MWNLVNKQQYVFSGVILVLIAVRSSTAQGMPTLHEFPQYEPQDLKTPWLVHTNTYSINGLEMDTWKSHIVIHFLSKSVSVDYHFTQGYLYWTDEDTGLLTRANLSNTQDEEHLVTYILDKADGMAVDWIYNHIYWIDATHKHVKMADLDGSLRKTLIDTDLAIPRAIVVHPSKGWLFFTDVFNPRVIRCGLDGSNRKTIVSNKTTNIGQPNGLSIDFSSNRLYWIDNVYKQIQSSNLNGKEIKRLTIAPDFRPDVWGLIVFRDWIYWTSNTNDTIYRVDKENRSNFEVVKTNLHTPFGIKIYSQENQPTGDNVCGQNNGGCEQLCLPSPSSTIKCACADGFQLKNDNKSCLDIGSGNWLTFTNLLKIERLDVETRVTETIATDSFLSVALDIHYNKGLVYWSDLHFQKIMRSSVTKDSVSGVSEDVVTEEIGSPNGMAVDWIYDFLYWTDSRYRHIQASRLNGTDRRTIVKDDSLVDSRAIVVDPIRGWLFFSDCGTNPRITRCRMDGTDRKIIVADDIRYPTGMSIDNDRERLYWIDGSLNQIKSTKFDGSDTHTILKNRTNISTNRWQFSWFSFQIDLVVFDSYVYWTNLIDESIYRVNKSTGQNLTLVASNADYPMGIQMFGAGAQVNGDNLCGDDNGMCSHICFPLPAYYMSKSTKTGCMCPDSFIMNADNKTCTEMERPSNIMINMTSSSSIAITWSLPVTSSNSIQETEVQLHNGNNYEVYNKVLYHLDTSLIIFPSSPMTSCDMYTVKLRCKYYKVGWSLYQEEKFWATDNIIFGEEGKDVVISWITKVNQSRYNVTFNQLSNQTDDLIYAKGVLQKNSTKYKHFNKNESHIQFTLTQFNKLDVGLYKSIIKSKRLLWHWSWHWSINGCAVLVMTDKPQKPNITFDKYPFVNGQTIFTCISRVPRWPTFVPYSLQYNWTVAGGVRNILKFNPISKSDKGKLISCRATDDLGMISDSSEAITLDPYYGPDNVSLSIYGHHVSVTQGRKLGPITCSAVCYPECDYIWKGFKNGVYSTVRMGQDFTIDSANMDDSGSYQCYVTHKNDSTRIGTTIMTICVNGKEPETSTVKKTTTTVESTTTVKPTIFIVEPTTSTMTAKSTTIMSNPPSRNVNKGDNTKDVTLYSVFGSVIVIGIVAGLFIFYYRRRRHQDLSKSENRNDKHSTRVSYDTTRDDIKIASHMEIENPNESDL